MEHGEVLTLEVAAQPLLSWLREHGDLHSTVVVTTNEIKVMQDHIGIPVEVED